MSTPALRVLFLPAIVVAFTGSPAVAATACSIAKADAVTKAFACAAAERSEEAMDGIPADYSSCEENLTEAFSDIEGDGDCLVTGDVATAWSMVADTADEMFEIYLASAETDPLCFVNRNRALSKYYRCRAKRIAAVVKKLAFPMSGGKALDACDDNFSHRKYLLFLDGCVELTDPVSGQVSSFFPGAKLAGGNFRNDFYQTDAHHFLAAYLVGADFQGADLREVALRGANLSGADLSNTNLEYASLHNANLSGANLAGANLHWTAFGNTDLSGVDMSTTNADSPFLVSQLAGCPAVTPPSWECRDGYLLGPTVGVVAVTFSGTDLSNFNLRESSFSQSTLNGVDLSNTDFTAAGLGSTTMGADVDFTGTVWTNTRFQAVTLDGADLSTVDFSVVSYLEEVSGVGLAACPVAMPYGWRCLANTMVGPTSRARNANLAGQNLGGMDLSESIFTGTNFAGANLSSCDVTRVWFENANLTGASFVGSSVTWNTGWHNTTCPDGTNSDSGQTCCGHFLGAQPTGCP